MKVICAGMPKTGTTTMAAALRMLGLSVYDFMENFEFLHDEWMSVVRRGWKTEDFRAMYENVDATCDSPAFYFWEELLEAFPNAKVILMVRDDEDKWFHSIRHQQRAYEGIHVLLFSLLSKTWWKLGLYAYYAGMVPFGSSFTQTFRIPELPFRQHYRRHNAHVIHNCPKEKILIFNCKEGWEPLCKFLGVPAPNKPFPVENVGGQVAIDAWKTDVLGRVKKEARITSFVLLLLVGYGAFRYANFNIYGYFKSI